MPNILIETRAGWITSPDEIISAVHSAVATALGLLEWDKTIRLVEHAPSHFPPPPGRSERFTLVNISMFSGRSSDAKRALYRCVVDQLEAVGVPPSDVTITLNEIGRENWGVRGGQMASEVDIGFKVDV
jgi:phenylpyruvate tautomerase PptA (4-oxalocrotonate tautomerase family)